MVGVKPFWPQCNGEEKSSLVKSRRDYLHLKNEVKKLRAHGKYSLSEIDKCTGSTTPKWGHWWVVEDSPKNHWKWEFLGVHSSWCEHLGVGRKGSVSGLASPCLFHRDGNVRIEAHYSSLLCKSSAHGIHDFVSHWSPHRFQFHLTTRTLIIIYTERRVILAACTCKKKICVLSANSFSVLSLALGLGGQNIEKLGSFSTAARNCQQIGQFCTATIIFMSRSKTASSNRK